MKAFMGSAHTGMFILYFSLTGRKTRAILSGLEAQMFYYGALAAQDPSPALKGSPRAAELRQSAAFLISDT